LKGGLHWEHTKPIKEESNQDRTRTVFDFLKMAAGREKNIIKKGSIEGTAGKPQNDLSKKWQREKGKIALCRRSNFLGKGESKEARERGRKKNPFYTQKGAT